MDEGKETRVKELADQAKAKLKGLEGELQPFGELESAADEKFTVMKTFSPRPLTEKLRAKYSFFYDERKRFFAFNKKEGIWRENAEELIARELRDKILREEAAKRYVINEVVADVRELSYQTRPLPEEPDWNVPFANGIYNLRRDSEGTRFTSYSALRFFISKLQANYDPEATCPTIDKIFSEIALGQVEDLYDLVALCLFRGYPVHRFWFLYGGGRNGKSVFAQLLTRVLGKENVATVSLADIDGNRFATSQLYGKFASISPEAAYETLTQTSKLKQLTGADLVFAERKFGQPFNFVNNAKLIFLANELPATNDKTKAFYSRVKIINFPRTFENEAADRRLVDGIPPDEFDGLAFKSLMRLQRFYDENFNNCFHESSDEMAALYEKLTDPLSTFLKERTEKDINGEVPKWELQEEFFAWCGEHGFRKWTEHRLGKEMARRGFDTEKKTIKEGTRWLVWTGLKLKNGEGRGSYVPIQEPVEGLDANAQA
jgi:putative DNA primase/helicase